MNKMLSRYVVACAWLFGASCTDDAHSNQHANKDANSQLDSSAGTNSDHDANTPANAEPVDQSPSAGANGLAFDADNMVWLADLFGGQVLRLNPTTGEILDRFMPDGIGPDDIAIDARGRVFWTDWTGGRVGRLDPKTKQNEFVGTRLAGANSIAFSDDGRLFVGLVALSRGLYEIDPEGVREPRLITDAIGSLNAFDIGPDGLLWGPLDDKIVKIDLDSGEVVETITQGAYASVRYNERDHALYALTEDKDKRSSVLEKIDVDDFTVSRFYKLELADIDNFAIGPDGAFTVTGYNTPKLETIDPEGSHGTLVQVGTAPEH